MKRLSALLFICGLGISFNANAWFFFFIPGSVTSAISDAITGSEGSNCVGQQVAVGGIVRLSNGGYARVKSLSGTSSRCPDSNMPIRAMLEPIPLGEKFTPPSGSSVAPIVSQEVNNRPLTTEARLELSDDWVQKDIPEALQKRRMVLIAGNKKLGAILYLSTAPQSELLTGEKMAENLLKSQVSKIDNPTASEIAALKINGANAWQFHVSGNLKNASATAAAGTAVTYTDTLYEGDKEIVVLNTVSTTENYERLRPDLFAIENSLTGIVKTSSSTSSSKYKAQAASPSSMEQAKAKCLDLGFKVATESFGQCVLKISK
jgi:hypothetical protein